MGLIFSDLFEDNLYPYPSFIKSLSKNIFATTSLDNSDNHFLSEHSLVD